MKSIKQDETNRKEQLDHIFKSNEMNFDVSVNGTD